MKSGFTSIASAGLTWLFCTAAFADAKSAKGGDSCSDFVFTLWDADHDTVLQPVANGDALPLEPWEFNIQATADSACEIQSMELTVDGPITDHKKENAAPFMLFGDVPCTSTAHPCGNNEYNTNVKGEDWMEGVYTVSATGYSGKWQGGDKVGTSTITFSVGKTHCSTVTCDGGGGVAVKLPCDEGYESVVALGECCPTCEPIQVAPTPVAAPSDTGTCSRMDFQGECKSTRQCQGMYGAGADDCWNGGGGVCYCGDDVCGCVAALAPVAPPVEAPVQAPVQAPTPDTPPPVKSPPTHAPAASPTTKAPITSPVTPPSKAPVAAPSTGTCSRMDFQGECKSTKQCQKMYSGADDCWNGGGGVCYCGDDVCGCGIVEETIPAETSAPTLEPTAGPTTEPTGAPVESPTTEAPAETPATDTPTAAPADAPTTKAPVSTSPPSANPTTAPVDAPTTKAPTTAAPTGSPVTYPTTSAPVTSSPSKSPEAAPTTEAPTKAPVAAPTTEAPTGSPVTFPTTEAPVTSSPSKTPVAAPTTESPTKAPVAAPTTEAPTESPVTFPTTKAPVTSSPSKSPVAAPTTEAPTRVPVAAPTTKAPTTEAPVTSPPSKAPVPAPTTDAPTKAPVPAPTTEAPTDSPTSSPTAALTPVPTPSPTFGAGPFQTILINAGGDEYVDFLGNVWRPDAYFNGGTTHSDETFDIIDTQSDPVFQTERNADFSFTYEIPVPLGNYEIIIHLAELKFSEPGQRVFDISVEGDSAFSSVDPVQQAGAARTAITLETVKLVSDGAVSLSFTQREGSVGGPKVSGIEIKEVEPHLAHAVAGGPYVAVAKDGASATVSVDGRGSHTHGVDLTLTRFTWRTGSTVLGTGETAELVVPVGEDTPLTLTVVDSGGNENTETTTVSVFSSDFPVVDSLSVVSGSVAGGEQITITGSGFTFTPTETTVHFGLVDLTGGSVQIINDSTIRVVSPAAALGTPVMVTVETPLGESNSVMYTYISEASIGFSVNGKVLNALLPTVVAFGPDRKLYIGTAKGKLFKIGFQDGNLKVNQFIEVEAAPTTVFKEFRAITGIAFDPMDTSDNPNVYFSHGRFFHLDPNNSSGASINAKVSMASGADLDTITDIITGLPISDHDHSINGMVFGDNGELYIQSGGNTNAGVPGQISGSRVQKEGALSSATLVAHLGRTNFDGTITYSADDDGDQTGGFDVEVFAAGQRNPYDLVMHSNGKLYGTDNGPNLGYGDLSMGCEGQSRPDVREQDKLNLLERGKYYGHANHKRGQTDPRQCVWHSGTESSTSEYTAPIVELPASSNGIFEWKTNHFAGELRGNLIVSKYKEEINRVILAADGKSVVPQSVPVIPLLSDEQAESLSITQAPGGEIIAARYLDHDIWFHRPDDVATSALQVLNVWPDRGGQAGGNTLSVYGKNLNKNGGNPTVTVGGANCPVTVVKAFRVACTLPLGSGTVDVVVTAGGETSVFSNGYRYITGRP